MESRPVSPDQWPALVREAAVGDDAKHRLTQAVAQCRAGNWDDGLQALGELAERFPHYPDVRAKHAAALYQVGRIDDALVEVDAALVVKDRYRNAVSLRGLLLAEQGRLVEAADYLGDSVPRLEGTAGRHEELFLAYLRAALALLLGDTDACRDLLAGWNDLGRQFARAELLLVACDDLAQRPDAAQNRLEDLCRLWNADPELTHLRAAMHLQRRQWSAVEATLSHWPQGSAAAQDQRPLMLQARLDVARGHGPQLPADAMDEESGVPPRAWRQLMAHAHLMAGRAEAALDLARALSADDGGDDETGWLLLRAAAACPGATVEPDAVRGVADRCLPELVRLLRMRGEAPRAERLLQSRRDLRPDVPTWSWLSAGFWLEPVRRWLA